MATMQHAEAQQQLPKNNVILIVDDNPTDQRIAGALIERDLGWKVACANDGREALAWMSKNTPDVVLTDLQMSEMNGLELVGAIRNRFPSVPVIVMTAFGSEKIAIDALQRGAASYVAKLRLEHDLIETIEQVVAAATRHSRRQQLEDRLTYAEFHFTLENDPALVPILVGRLQEYLVAMHFTGREGDVRAGIALEEALLNALYHGNLEVSSALRIDDDAPFQQLSAQRRNLKPFRDRRIHVTARMSCSEAIFVIRDEGPGFAVSTLPDPTEVENLDKPSGRGVILMRSFMDGVEFNERGNQVTLTKRKVHSYLVDDLEFQT